MPFSLDGRLKTNLILFMSLDTNQILKLIQSLVQRPMKVKELAQTLGVPKPDYVKFKRSIKSLLESGDLVRLKRNRVGLASEMNVVVGEISITRTGVGFVPHEGHEDIMIPASQLGTALDRDKVMVRLGSFRGERQTGSVVRVIQRADRKIVGVFKHGPSFSFVTADNPHIHRDILIPESETLGAAEGEKVVARLTVWDDPYRNPEGKIVERLGRPGDPGVDMLTIIKSFDLPEEFPPEVLEEAERRAVIPGKAELVDRTDFTSDCIYTIDPADAKDFDDAVSVEKRSDGYRLGVHIADVSYYVVAGSVIDTEAFRRGNSVYLPGTVIPMIPEILSNDVCSLNPNRRRLTHSIVIDFDNEGKMLSWKLYDAVIKSRSRLVYEEVQEYFDKGTPPNDRVKRVADNLTVARELARLLSKRRFAEGSLDFDLPEAKIVLNEKGEVLELGNRVRLEAHRLVEEFMLAANRAVALEVFRKGQPFLYRVHDKPDLEKLNDFSHMMTRLGYSFPVSEELKPIQFARFLEKIKDKPEADFINELMLRSMQKAVYQLKNIGHFGLAFTHYTHFTSPIRRYPDLLVHRLLRQLKQGHYPVEYARRVVSVINHVGEHCSETERIAEQAERQAVKVKQVQFMAKKLGEEYSGVISGVLNYGFFVRLDNMGVEGMVRLSSLEDDYYVFDEKEYRLVGRRTGRVFRMGDAIKVGVMRVDTAAQEIELFVIEDGSGKKSAVVKSKTAKTKQAVPKSASIGKKSSSKTKAKTRKNSRSKTAKRGKKKR
ncbi:MAG TPA: ribonuclease R [candidate division Zixibacteria bacterium]|nr:ribonuclease R [candidate division Zixibacteria bacterium]